MSALTIYNEQAIIQTPLTTDFLTISQQLNAVGVQFERWTADIILESAASSESILNAYAASIQRLNQHYGFQSVDVIHLDNTHPDKEAIREKFLAEHTHDDFEIRFFVRGKGLFYLHLAELVYVVLCEQGDLISVPANTAHWFDLGTAPQLSAIRLFTTNAGWLATFTHSDIALKFPSLDSYCEAFL